MAHRLGLGAQQVAVTHLVSVCAQDFIWGDSHRARHSAPCDRVTHSSHRCEVERLATLVVVARRSRDRSAQSHTRGASALSRLKLHFTVHLSSEPPEHHAEHARARVAVARPRAASEETGVRGGRQINITVGHPPYNTHQHSHCIKHGFNLPKTHMAHTRRYFTG